MPKFLYVTDIHNKSERNNPKGRSDNYCKSVLAKQEELIGLIHTLKPDVLLFGGDLFDTFDPPMSLVNDVAGIWKQYDVNLIVGVIGSHDYNGYQIKTLRRTGIGNFVTHGLMKLVGDSSSGCETYVEYENVIITGTPHTYFLSDNPENYATPQCDKGKVVIQLVHGDLYYKPVMWKHQTIEQVHPFIKADLVLSGHIHSGWTKPIVLKNSKTITGDTVYINPGSIGRTENGSARDIRVVEIDVTLYEIVTRFHSLNNVIVNPFIETSDAIEGSPVTDFSHLMRMISSLDLKPTDFKSHIPVIVEELYSNSEFKQEVLDFTITAFENAQ